VTSRYSTPVPSVGSGEPDSCSVSRGWSSSSNTRTVAHLKQEFLRVVSDDKWAVVPEHDGRHGHPIIVGRELIEHFLRAPAQSTARDVEHAHQQRIVYVHVADAHVIQNVDTPEEYQNLSGR